MMPTSRYPKYQSKSSTNTNRNTQSRGQPLIEIWSGTSDYIDIDGYSSEDDVHFFNHRSTQGPMNAALRGRNFQLNNQSGNNSAPSPYPHNKKTKTVHFADDNISDISDISDNSNRSNSNTGNPRFRAMGSQPLEDVIIYAHYNINQSILKNYKMNNVDATISTSRDKRCYYSETGLDVLAPNSGEVFNLKEHPRGITKATFDHTKVHDDETLALTIMNMIENVISKGGPLNLKTDDAFVATITKLYVEVLKGKGLEFDYNPPNNNFKSQRASIKEAEEIFHAISQKMDFDTNLIERNCPWFSSAMNECQTTLTPSIKTRF